MPGTPSELAGQVVVITGAANGIGQATTLAFAREASRVMLVDVDESGMAATRDAAIAEGAGAAITVTADVTAAEGAALVARHVTQHFGTANILVNVVGGSRPGKTVDELTEHEWNDVVAFNLTSTFMMCRAIIPLIRQAGGGAVVNVASGAGLHGMARNPGYCAAKAGVVGLTRALAIDHAADGIRVNCVSPGAVLTPLMRRNRTVEEIEQLGSHALLGRVAQPSELADAIVHLASSRASYLTGTVIEVDGGRTS